jgi:hypothetical protein
MRIWLSLAALIAAVSTACAQQSSAPRPTTITLSVRPIALNAENPTQNGVGALRYLGGLELASNAIDFGGLSGLVVSADQSQLLAITDKSFWFCADVELGAQGQLITLENAWMMPLEPLSGFDFTKKKQADAEALSIDPAGQNAFVAFEGMHRVWRYAIPDAADLCSVAMSRPSAVAGPAGLSDLPVNGGIESLDNLQSGALIMIAEAPLRKNKGQPGWVIPLEQAASGRVATPFTYQSPAPFKPTDIAVTGDGVFILQRHYSVLSGVSGALSWIERAQIEKARTVPGTQLNSTLLAQFAPPLSVDNFEGLSALPDGQGGYVLYIISDDNFSPFQRTLLLKFSLSKDALKAALKRP